jgi:hypothetical protein
MRWDSRKYNNAESSDALFSSDVDVDAVRMEQVVVICMAVKKKRRDYDGKKASENNPSVAFLTHPSPGLCARNNRLV